MGPSIRPRVRWLVPAQDEHPDVATASITMAAKAALHEKDEEFEVLIGLREEAQESVTKCVRSAALGAQQDG